MIENVNSWTTQVTLAGRFVCLRPLNESHVPDLALAGHDSRIWKYMLYAYPDTEEKMLSWVQDILARQAKGKDLPFAVIHLESGRAIGATRYLDIRPMDRCLEIGGTWYAVAYQRTAVNTECKYLLLRYAFETLGVVRVQFKTDLRNEPSINALERIGAVKEGILRKHRITPDGFVRDSVFFSILDNEWPEVKVWLEARMAHK